MSVVNNPRGHSTAFLACALIVLVGTGLYQRVANPSLEYHLAVPSPSQADAHNHPPLTAGDTEKLGKAMVRLREAPADIDLLLEIAGIFARNKDWGNAVRFFDRAAETAPLDMRPLHHLGVAFAAMGEYANAALAFEKALSLDPESMSARFNLAILYRHYLDKTEKALELLRAIVDSPAADSELREKARQELDR